MTDGPETTVLVVTWRARDLLAECLTGLRSQTVPHRLLVIDNASSDGTASLLASFPEARVLRMPRNLGFAGGVAAGLAAVGTPYVALLNDDAVPSPGWLAALLAALPGHAAVTSRMLLPSGRLNNAGVVLRADGYGADRGLGAPDGPPYDEPAEVFGFSGGAALLSVPVLRDVGGFPARYFLYYEDTDVSWRLRLAGHAVGYAPGAVVRHAHSASADQTSALFSFHNERNRLLTVVRCAPASFAVRQLLRFGLTTGSLAAKRLLRRDLPAAPHFRTGLRLRVLVSFGRMLPWALRTRRAIGRQSTVDRAGLLREWAG
ncbi:MAG TPA: glycosyltransferase family 2 protein [Mycobacteriales bacterium]